MRAGWVRARPMGTAPFLDESGGLSFMTEAAIMRDLNRWLDETTDEISIDFDIAVKRDLVKKALSDMHTDQLHCGERHGLQKMSCGSATHWSIAFDLAHPSAAAPFSTAAPSLPPPSPPPPSPPPSLPPPSLRASAPVVSCDPPGEGGACTYPYILFL